MIKKHRNRNEYFFSGYGWVRNFTKSNVNPVDINNFIPEKEMQILLENELANKLKMLQKIDTEPFKHNNILILGSGFNFNEKQNLIPDNCIVIGVNESLKLFNKKMHYYVVNNPYKECLDFIGSEQRLWPRCIASTRTNSNFVKQYRGIVYEYTPVIDQMYGGSRIDADYLIDDYRNPICAAISLAYKFDVKKLFLLCCDEAFEQERPGCEKLPNNKWIYPQQKKAHSLVDGCLYWLKESKIKTGYHCDGLEYKYATYIKEDLHKFFAE